MQEKVPRREHGVVDVDVRLRTLCFRAHWLQLWKSVDVYGRLWMAPRAGFQMHRKCMKDKRWMTAHLCDTPSDTPSPSDY